MVARIIKSDSIAHANQVLDKGLQQILTRCKEMQDDLEARFAGKLELLESQRGPLAAALEPWTCRLYKEMAETMFEVLKIMQPEDFAGAADVNFYFWPGYHSYLTNKRMFCRSDERLFLGVGVCGNMRQTTTYDDCHQARWYRFAVTPVEESFPPASPYHYFELQRPTVTNQPHDLIASLTFSTDLALQSQIDFPEHQVVTLGHSGLGSIGWGEEVAAMLNGLPHLKKPGKKFPYRFDLEGTPNFDAKRDHDLRNLRLYLIALWLHSAFKTEEPGWWPKVVAELTAQDLNGLKTLMLNESQDPVAADWADERTNRPPFTTLTTICFHPLVAPSPRPIIGPMELARTGGASTADHRNIGWATVLCSAPMRVGFISLIRDWIDRVYGTIRNTEVSLVLKHREPLDRAAQMVQIFNHEMRTFMDEQLATILLELSNSTLAAVARREFVILALQNLIDFTYGLTHAAPDPNKVIAFRRKFIESLLSVKQSILKDVFCQVGLDVQTHHVGSSTAQVTIPAPQQPVNVLSLRRTYVSCMLLAGEMIRNYYEHAPSGAEATFAILIDNTIITLTLEGPTRGIPPSKTFGLLHNFLEGLGLGEATCEGDEKAQRCTWTVRVHFGERRCA